MATYSPQAVSLDKTFSLNLQLKSWCECKDSLLLILVKIKYLLYSIPFASASLGAVEWKISIVLYILWRLTFTGHPLNWTIMKRVVALQCKKHQWLRWLCGHSDSTGTETITFQLKETHSQKTGISITVCFLLYQIQMLAVVTHSNLTWKETSPFIPITNR